MRPSSTHICALLGFVLVLGLERPRARGRGFRWVLHFSGGPASCASYRREVPARVLRELSVRGTDGRVLRSRVAVAVALAAAATTGAVEPAAAQQPAPGFEARLIGEGLAEPAQPECYVARSALLCTFAGRLPTGASCDVGGAVPAVRLTRRGRARSTHVCMDEGFHDWRVLRPRRSWNHGVFRCRHRWRGRGLGRHTELRCTNGRHSFRVLPSGAVRRSQ